MPPEISHTHILRYSLVFQASTPPEEEYLTPSLVLKEDWLVDVLVIPSVGFPLGSVVAKQNSISVSAATDWKPAGVLIASEFNLLKSSFNMSICDCIWAVLKFSVGL